MKVVINDCFGGFSLSAQALKFIADAQNKPIYFFESVMGRTFADTKYRPLSAEKADKTFLFTAFDIPNPDYLDNSGKWHEMSMEERTASNDNYSKHSYSARDMERNDPLLIAAVEALGKKAGGAHASLKIVEIPDDVKWHIEEYDGSEHVAEDHRTWR